MPDKASHEIFVLDDEQAVLDSAHNTFPKDVAWRLETTHLIRNNGPESLQKAIDALAQDPQSLLLIDSLPVTRDAQMRQRLASLTEDSTPRLAQIILCSWQPPGAFEADVEQFGLAHLRRLHKPLLWADILPDAREATGAKPAGGAKKSCASLRRRRLIRHSAGDYRVHPADSDATAFWPPPRFNTAEIDRLRQGEAVVQAHRGWLPWSGRDTAMDWYQLLTIAHRRNDDPSGPELLSQYALPRPESWQPPTPDDAVANLFSLMAEVGFHRGRYYEIDQLPDANGTFILQLTRANHSIVFEGKTQTAQAVLPVARVLQGDLLAHATQFITVYEEKKREKKIDELTYEVRQKCAEQGGDAADPDMMFWNALVGTQHLAARLDIPIYLKKLPDSRTQASPGLSRLAGWMIFDRLTESVAGTSTARVDATAATDFEAEKAQIEERIGIVESLLRQAIDQIRAEREKRQSRHSERQSQSRKEFRQRLGQAASRAEREQALVDFAMDAGGLAPKSQESSVIYARFDAATKSLTVTQDTTGQLLEQEFPISAHFALTRCADSKKLRVVPKWDDLPAAEKIHLADWQNLPGMDHERAKELCKWVAAEILTTVALPILSPGGSLLGVLLERHKRPYHFSRQRIDNLQSLVDTALPYLELDAALATADTWHGAVMHEIRSGIQTPYQSLHRLWQDASLSAAQRRAIRSALYAIEDLRDVSNLFLETIGKRDRRTRDFGHLLTDDWFAAIDDYGRYRADAWGGFKTWQAEYWPPGEPRPALAEPEKLTRVLRILVDNAFRYGKTETDSGVRLVTRQEASGVHITVGSDGAFSDSILRGNFRHTGDRLDLGGRSLRAHLGLSLANDLIHEHGQTLSLKNAPNDQMAVAEFIWPLDVRNTGTSEKGR